MYLNDLRELILYSHVKHMRLYLNRKWTFAYKQVVPNNKVRLYSNTNVHSRG